ncbi:MAG: LL-diaminopimelate aminotransferase [Clostridia bacterium]|nr:LL-diaminopimelate aminotransferase [Clostridia bacterium]
MKFNENFKNIAENYLFAEVADRTKKYASANPDKKIIKLGIGDVTLPLAPAVIKAMHGAVDEMADAKTFKGYGPYEGYSCLREKIQSYYRSFGVEVEVDEIFISDGAKSDLGNILDIFAKDNTVLVTDPVYPVYVDTNLMAGRKVILADATEENGFLPMPDKKVKADIIYICSPNNPTGAAYTKAQLKEWVDYANGIGAVILYDAAYECFIEDNSLARSVYSVDGAKSCAIEFCSFSKMAGFTGTRCGYTVVPKALGDANKIWYRRQATKFNGTSYVVQKGAEAVFSQEGQRQIKANIGFYKENAKLISECMDRLKIKYTGGKNSPYIWLKCPDGMNSWQFFDCLLENAQVVGTPGSGFGRNGEGFFRLTAFGGREETEEALERIEKLFAK